MSPNELKRKIESGERLSPMEMALLDAYLEEGESSNITKAVKRLPAETPSMAWRSKLNERLLAVQPKRRLNIFSRRWFAISAGVATACALAVAFVFYASRSTEVPGSSATEEMTAVLIEWHEEAAASTILPSDGTSLEGFKAADAPYEPSEIERLLYGGDALKTL